MLVQNDTRASAPRELRRRFGAENEDETILETNLLEMLLVCDDGEVPRSNPSQPNSRPSFVVTRGHHTSLASPSAAPAGMAHQ